VASDTAEFLISDCFIDNVKNNYICGIHNRDDYDEFKIGRAA
jgi:hypothetical protein